MIQVTFESVEQLEYLRELLQDIFDKKKLQTDPGTLKSLMFALDDARAEALGIEVVRQLRERLITICRDPELVENYLNSMAHFAPSQFDYIRQMGQNLDRDFDNYCQMVAENL